MNSERSSRFAGTRVIRLIVSGFAAVFFGIAPAPAAESKSNAPEIPMIREVAPGVFEAGKMRIDKSARSVTFPGAVNLEKGLLEYLIVTREGATHESLLVSDILPSDLHFAMLLLGAKGAGLTTGGAADRPPAQIDAEYLRNAPKLKGDRVFITVKWKKKDGSLQSAPIEDWLRQPESRKAAPRGPWIYTGSMFADGQFLAQLEGLLAALVTNPSALINNPRKGNDSDAAWEVNESARPPVDTPVEITVRLEAGENEPKTKPK